ncbi:MAG: hypothetical protein COB02_13985 [Candidatus Cloacimonadota bacterium]|nr:MAG: hypothetical protein COB02_13985 [Candidatus Cloacimonadota bacterium]
MNLLKLLSTTQKGFPGDYLLALYSWLLNPKMDHGLNCVPLASFIRQIQSEHTELLELVQDLEDFPYRFLPNINIQMHKIINPDSPNPVMVDLNIQVGSWNFIILNTIDLGQNYDRTWLKGVYQAGKSHFKEHKIGLILLTQVGLLHYKHPAKSSYNELNMISHHDFKAIMGWEPSEKSIYNSIQTIADYFVNELPVSTQSVLFMFDEYLAHHMIGYQEDKYSFLYGSEKIPVRQLRIKEILHLSNGWVKIPNGLSGMLRMRPEHLEVYNFSYTVNCMQRKRFWIEIDVLKEFVQWYLDESKPVQINSQFILLNTKNLKSLIDSLQAKIFIHIEEGLLSFRKSSLKEIKNRVWEVSYTKLTKKDKSKWINGLQLTKEIEKVKL